MFDPFVILVTARQYSLPVMRNGLNEKQNMNSENAEQYAVMNIFLVKIIMWFCSFLMPSPRGWGWGL